MKTSVNKILSLILCLSVLCITNIKAQQKTVKSSASAKALPVPTCLFPAINEPTIDLTPHEKSEPSANFEIAETKKHLGSPASGVKFSIDLIPKDAFCNLREDAIQLATQYTNCSTHIAALRMRFGMNGTFDSVVVIYEPVILCEKAVAANSGTYSVKAGSNPKRYRWSVSSQTFQPATSESVCATYSNNIILTHSTNATPSGFKSGTDIESVIFSFQEIGALINDNPSNNVKVWNAITKNKLSGNDSTHFHSIILGPGQLTGPKTKYFAAFVGKYANLAHLCPPSCGEVYFRLRP